MNSSRRDVRIVSTSMSLISFDLNMIDETSSGRVRPESYSPIRINENPINYIKNIHLSEDRPVPMV